MESLIQHMTALYHQVSARLLQLRVSRAQVGPAAYEEVGLVEALIERLQAVANAGSWDARDHGAVQSPPSAIGAGAKGAEQPASPSHTSVAAPPLPPLGERPPSLSREEAGAGVQTPLATQLQRQTLRYVGQAIDFARQGKADLAEACAHYAESTLRLAAQHLPAEDYQGFRDQILARLVHSTEDTETGSMDPAPAPLRTEN